MAITHQIINIEIQGKTEKQMRDRDSLYIPYNPNFSLLRMGNDTFVKFELVAPIHENCVSLQAVIKQENEQLYYSDFYNAIKSLAVTLDCRIDAYLKNVEVENSSNWENWHVNYDKAQCTICHYTFGRDNLDLMLREEED